MQALRPSLLCATLVPAPGESGGLPSIPGYRMVRKLGQGGMASVYLARQITLDRAVAIKIMEHCANRQDTAGMMQRFENEARTIARLTHPGIVEIYDVGRMDDGRLYYVMPFLGNGDLLHHDLTGKELRILEVLRALLSALGFAHSRGIVHRDVKPENVLFDGDDRPQLTDFGIALSRASDRRITSDGMVVGSCAYMAPEQAQGLVVDGRADLYSVGVLAYELLTGQLPFRSADPLALAVMHAQREVPRLPIALHHWQMFIDHAMAKKPGERYPDAQAMARALDRITSRSGPHLPQRALRTLDRTAPGDGWKRPRLLALFALFLAVSAVYAGRHRLLPVGLARVPAITATPAPPPSKAAAETTATPAPARDFAATMPVLPPADAAAAASADTASSSSTDTPAPKPRARANAARRHAAATPAAARPGLLGRLWQHIRHPIAASRSGAEHE